MFLLIGLGNPEQKYAGNRHNIGFQMIDALADHHNFTPPREKFHGIIRDGSVTTPTGNVDVLTLKAMTYYNETGRAVQAAAKFYKIPAENIIVFHDELDLAPAKLKIKLGGGTGGNNGLRSMCAHIKGDFRRVRMGIGHPGHKELVTKHVLSDFAKAERAEWVDKLLDECARELGILLSDEKDRDAKFMSAVAMHMNPPRPKPKMDKIKADIRARKDAQKQATKQEAKSNAEQEQSKKSGSMADALAGLLKKD